MDWEMMSWIGEMMSWILKDDVHGLGGNVMDSISGSSLESEELSQWKSVQAGIRADYSQYSQGIFETLSLEGATVKCRNLFGEAFQQVARLGRR